MGARHTLRLGDAPIGLAHRLKLKNDIAAGQVVSRNDVDFDAGREAIRVRREMESTFAREWGAGAGGAKPTKLTLRRIQ